MEDQNDVCDFRLSLEDHLRWVTILQEHKDTDHCGPLLSSLIILFDQFADEFRQFAYFLLVNSEAGLHKDKCCFMNLRKDGFQLCRCYTESIENFAGEGDIKIKVLYCDRYAWDWSYSRDEWRIFLKTLDEMAALRQE